MKRSLPERAHLGPGSLWTGNRAYSLDGALVALEWSNDTTDPQIERIEFELLHEIGVARRRTLQELQLHMGRCSRTLRRDGAIVAIDGEVYFVRPEKVHIKLECPVRVFHRVDRTVGPFNRTRIQERDDG